MQFEMPLAKQDATRITQTYAQHVARAKAMGCCSQPGCGLSCFYFGGIDWGIPTGTLVFAARKGKVVKATLDSSGYGLHIRIDHGDGWMSLYGHNSQLLVVEGQQVDTGDLIAKSGNTGNSTGPHLHFEVRHNNSPQDPAPLFVASIEDDPEELPVDIVFPNLPEAKILETGLRVRANAGVGYRVTMSSLFRDDIVKVMGTKTENGNLWLQIGHNAWCAMQHDGKMYATWVKET